MNILFNLILVDIEVMTIEVITPIESSFPDTVHESSQVVRAKESSKPRLSNGALVGLLIVFCCRFGAKASAFHSSAIVKMIWN
jgi:hypothetical protein